MAGKFKVYTLTSTKLKKPKTSDRAKYLLEDAEDLLDKLKVGDSLTITVGEEDFDDEDFDDEEEYEEDED